MKLCFSTLGCPGWSWDGILKQAKALGFSGVEVRGIGQELDNEKLEPFSDANASATVSRLKELGLEIPCLDTSCTFLSETPLEETLRAGRAAIDIARRIGAPCIRVFGDRIPDGMGEAEAVSIVARGMNDLASYAEGKGVLVLQETHGNFADSRVLLDVFSRVNSPAAGILWDIANPYEFGETVEKTWSAIGGLVRHVHAKDIKKENGNLIPVLPGRGIVPIGGAIRALKDAGYKGWVSFEWEKRWHTGIEEPEVALPAFLEHIKQYL